MTKEVWRELSIENLLSHQKKNMKNNLLFIGYDNKSQPYHIEIPDRFVKYKNAIENAINTTFFSSYIDTDIVPKSFLNNMKSRYVLHKFIEKHTLNFFNSIKNDDELEELIKNEFQKLFDIKDEQEFKKIYRHYKKDVSVSYYMINLYKKKLLEYKDRLDKVEL